MKIAIDVSRANKNRRTGVERYAFHVISGLIKLMCSEDSIVLYSNDRLAEDWPDFVHKAISSGRVDYVNASSIFGYCWTHTVLGPLVKKNKHDLLFIPAHVMPIFIGGVKSVMTVHDLAVFDFPKVFSFKENFYQKFALWYAVRSVDHLIVPSNFTKQELIKYYPKISKDKITVIKHGIDSSWFSKTNDNLYYSELIGENPYFIYIGRLEYKKNIANVVRAFNTFRSNNPALVVKLLLAGKPGFGYDSIKEVMRDSVYAKDIIELGWVDDKELQSLLHGSVGFVFMSLYEGFGLPLLEACAGGVPIMTSNTGACFELGEKIALTIDPSNVNRMAKGFEILYERGSEVSRRILDGMEYARKFDWLECASLTYAVLKKVSNES